MLEAAVVDGMLTDLVYQAEVVVEAQTKVLQAEADQMDLVVADLAEDQDLVHTEETVDQEESYLDILLNFLQLLHQELIQLQTILVETN